MLFLHLAVIAFACLVIRTFQFVFSVGTEFFSHNKLDGTVFRSVFSAKRTGPESYYVRIMSSPEQTKDIAEVKKYLDWVPKKW